MARPGSGRAAPLGLPAARGPGLPDAVSGPAPQERLAAVGGTSGSRGEPASIPVAGETLGDLPGYCLAHLVGESVHDGSATRRYDLYPVEVPRPAHGWTTATIVCGTCGEVLPCTVSSLARLRRECRRRRAEWLAMATAMAGSFTALGFAVLLGGEHENRSGLLTSVVVLLFLAWFPGFLVVTWWAIRLGGAGRVTGVKLPKGDRHEVRRPGDTMSVHRWDTTP